MSPTRGGAMHLDKEDLRKLSFCNAVLICLICALSSEFPSQFLYIN